MAHSLPKVTFCQSPLTRKRFKSSSDVPVSTEKNPSQPKVIAGEEKEVFNDADHHGVITPTHDDITSPESAFLNPRLELSPSDSLDDIPLPILSESTESSHDHLLNRPISEGTCYEFTVLYFSSRYKSAYVHTMSTPS